jgi:receptor expression-enhancing protein 5/6
MDKIEEICQRFGLDKYGDVPLIKKASQMSGQPHWLIVFGITIILLLSCISPPGQWLCSVIFSFLLPAYLSFKAIESPTHEDDKKWLTYWVVFGFNYCFEDVIFGLFFWVPLIGLIRTALLVFLFVSKEKGSEFLFRTYVGPAFGKIQQICGGWIEAFEGATGLSKSHIE